MTKFLLLMNYGRRQRRHADARVGRAGHQGAHAVLSDHLERLRQSGELVEAQALTWPQHAKVVRAASVSAPVLTDGPYAESKEVLAGYTMVDVESEERALEIAAEQSAAPGPGGVPIEQPIEVRRVMESDADVSNEHTPRGPAA